MRKNNNSKNDFAPSKSSSSTKNKNLTSEHTSTTTMLLSERQFMVLETKFITYLNEKYLKGPGTQLFPGSKSNPKNLLQAKEKNINVEEKKSFENKEHKLKKHEIHKKQSLYEENTSSCNSRKNKQEDKPAGFLRSLTLSPRKSAIKHAMDDQGTSSKKKNRVKFNKKNEVFKVENFKDELRKLKLMSNY